MLCQFTHPTKCDHPGVYRVVIRSEDGQVAEDRMICPAHVDMASYTAVGYTVTITPDPKGT